MHVRLAQILRINAQFPDFSMKVLQIDSGGEYTSSTFDNFCIAIGLDAQYLVPHIHFQNGPAK